MSEDLDPEDGTRQPFTIASQGILPSGAPGMREWLRGCVALSLAYPLAILRLACAQAGLSPLSRDVLETTGDDAPTANDGSPTA
jgi:hypothetical protein